MSRFRASGEFAYREPAPPPRWDGDRLQRERDYRDYQEYDEYYQPAAPPPRRAARPVYEEERVYRDDERFGPRGSYVERQYFEEDGYYDPRAQRGQMIPFRPARPPRSEAPPRPGLLRRQSSLDTFDRPPARRYEDIDGYRSPPQRPPRMDISVPEQPSPRSNRYRPARPSRPVNDYYEQDQREYYDDVAIQDPDYYGDDGFREYREREWISKRRRDSSSERSQTRSRPATEAPVEEVKKEKKETVRKEEIKEEVKEKPYPRRGKTKMPKRLVHTKVLFDLGYPYYEENDKTIIIEKALGPDNIDEVFAKSREYREKEVSTTRLIEAPPPAPAPAPAPSISVRSPPPRAPTVAPPSVHEDFRESIFKEEVKTKSLAEAPRSVREWDQMTRDDNLSVRTSNRRKSTARSRSRRRSNSPKETVVERRSTIIEREPSRSPEPQRRRRRKSKSRRRSSSASVDETEIIERRITTEQDDFFPGESNSVHVGPLAMVIDRNRENRTERELRAKIRELENEQRNLKYERGSRIIDDDEFIRIENRTRARDDDIVRVENRTFGRDDDIVRVENRTFGRDDDVIRIENRTFGRDDDAVKIVRRPSRSRSRERFRDRDRDLVRIERRSRSRSSEGTDVIYEKTYDDGVEVRKSVRERSISRARAPSAGLVKAMLYTAT